MIIKSRDIEIPKENPFANDVLERQESAEILTEFVTSSNDPMVICIDAPWGMGKTTFLRMWEQHLKNQKIPTLYFNAWENDFSDDALVCLIGEISASINEISEAGNESEAKKYLDKVKKLGGTLLKRSIPVLAKMGTMGALDLDEAKESALSDFAESIANEQIEHYEKSKQGLLAFRKTLSSFASSITNESDKKPLIFIIDELDRCRPNFAIEILEKAKHFFNVENIVFVLGADKEQLGSSIKAIYGDGLNVNGYLRRFIDFDYLFPKLEGDLFLKGLFNKYSFDKYFAKKKRELQVEEEHALEMFSELFPLYGLTLREQEHCCSLLALTIKTTPLNHSLHPFFLCFLIILKIKEPEIYKKVRVKKISSKELLEYLYSNSSAISSFIGSDNGAILEAYIISGESDRNDLSQILSYYDEIIRIANVNNVRTTKGVDRKERVSRKLRCFFNYQFEEINNLHKLINKIEIASRFTKIEDNELQ